MSVYFIAKRINGDYLIAEAGYLIHYLTKHSKKIEGVYTQQVFLKRKTARKFLEEHFLENERIHLASANDDVIELVKTIYEQQRIISMDDGLRAQDE